MPFDGSARSPQGPHPDRRPPPVETWTPRAFSAPILAPSAEWGRFLVAFGAGLVLFGVVALILLQF
ncbi:hypothetical protein [Rubritepida flocculans]|uniref:hypothetical protein n=1 Tax=Rubritepida flocculans TaxID=182403 RepID=UPI000425C992|nr:hypothetical protein [Rubritepida flocculans]